MDPIYVGWFSILPPVIAIILALLTKEVLFSLMAGVLSGTFIYSLSAGLNPVVGSVQVAFDIMIQKADMNIIIFCFLLSALVYLVKASGGTEAYGRWASKKIRSKKASLLLTSLLGCLIFIDDYFNCLTVGTVMKPVTDRYQVSRAKLAYIIDSTAAPVCIIAPISSWAAAVGSYLKNTGAFHSEFSAFVTSIPYNFYALLSILMVILVSAFSLDFGPMAKAEARALQGDNGSIDEDHDSIDMENTSLPMEHSLQGTVADMLIPILVLIIISILGMLYNGGFWTVDSLSFHNFVAALGNCTAAQALVWGGFSSIITCLILYIPRKIMSLHSFMKNMVKGMEKMVTSACILFLAWSIGGICRDLLCTQDFVKSLVVTTGMSAFLLPVMIFVVAAFLSFATGTSWGTFGILIPIIVPVAQSLCPELLTASLAATLAGSIFGDHCSPISDTTILSSAGAGVMHLEHVSTQMIYSLTVASCSVLGYIVIGITNGNLLLSLSIAVISLILVTILLHRHSIKKLSFNEKQDM